MLVDLETPPPYPHAEMKAKRRALRVSQRRARKIMRALLVLMRMIFMGSLMALMVAGRRHRLDAEGGDTDESESGQRCVLDFITENAFFDAVLGMVCTKGNANAAQ